MCNKHLCPCTDAMANPSPAKSIGDPGITPLSPSHIQVTHFSNGLNVFLYTLYIPHYLLLLFFVLIAVFVQFFKMFVLLTKQNIEMAESYMTCALEEFILNFISMTEVLAFSSNLFMLCISYITVYMDNNLI